MSYVAVGCKLPHGLIIEIQGKAARLNGARDSIIEGGYGITEGVDTELWDTWSATEQGVAFLKTEMVFAHAKKTEVQSEGKDKAVLKTGLEPLDKGKMPSGLEVAK
jgi:hypothetical protein